METLKLLFPEFKDVWAGDSDESVWPSEEQLPTPGSTAVPLPSSNTNAAGPSLSEPFATNDSSSINVRPNGATVPQCVAPASIQYSPDPIRGVPAQPDTFRATQSLAASTDENRRPGRVWEIDTPASFDAPASAQLPSAYLPADLHPDQTRQSRSSFEAQEVLSYGTDPCIGKTQYTAHTPEFTKENSTTQYLIRFGLFPQGSAHSTRTPSPQTSGQEAYSSAPSLGSGISTAESSVAMSVGRHSPRKRKWSTVEEPGVSPPSQSSSSAPKKKRGRPAKCTGEEAAKVKKEPRLTFSMEEQRVKHLQAEKDRRKRDKDAWEALLPIVPSLGDKRSKVGDVLYAHKWLMQVMEDNAKMERCLQESAAAN